MTHLKPETQAAQAMGKIDSQTKALIPPVYHSTTYQRDSDNSYPEGHVYARDHNPTYRPAEELICELEQGKEALLFSSGMAAAIAVLQALNPGDVVIAPRVMYWSLRNWLTRFTSRWGVELRLLDTDDLSVMKENINSGTRLVWLETPANPMWAVSDIEEIAKLSKAAGAKLVVDSTVATPVFTQPLTLGADIVMHSATKYLNGHSDVISGALVCAEQDEFWSQVCDNRREGGAIPGPLDAYLLSRGMRTLFLRVRHSAASALYLAEQLNDHEHIAEVLYPGLPGFPGHVLACKQMQGGFGGMLSIRVNGGQEKAIATAAAVKLWKRATSLGGVESLIEHRASIEGDGTPVPDDLLRLSVGIENVDDLLQDLSLALQQANKT